MFGLFGLFGKDIEYMEFFLVPTYVLGVFVSDDLSFVIEGQQFTVVADIAGPYWRVFLKENSLLN